MLPNCCYNKVKVLYKLSKLAWFLNKHAIPQSAELCSHHEQCSGKHEHHEQHKDKAHHEQCVAAYKELLKDLQKHVDIFKKLQ